MRKRATVIGSVRKCENVWEK